VVARPTYASSRRDSDAGDIAIWHSDEVNHGRSPGKIGVTWHTSLIARVPLRVEAHCLIPPRLPITGGRKFVSF